VPPPDQQHLLDCTGQDTGIGESAHDRAAKARDEWSERRGDDIFLELEFDIDRGVTDLQSGDGDAPASVLAEPPLEQLGRRAQPRPRGRSTGAASVDLFDSRLDELCQSVREVLATQARVTGGRLNLENAVDDL